MSRSYRFAITALFIALCAGTFVGCDSAEEEAIDELTGDWVSNQQGFELFLRISSSRIFFAAESFGSSICDFVEIVSYDPDTNTMTIRDPNDEEDFTIRRDGDDLIFDGDRFEQTDNFPSDCS